MKFLYVAGGTAGHVFPAQAIVEQNPDKSTEHFCLTDSRGEKYVSKILYTKIFISNIKRKEVKTFWCNFRFAWEILKEIKPDGVFVFGGYTSLFPAIAAWLRRIPVFVIEPNALMGKANRILQRIATKTFITFPQTIYASKKAIHIGFLARKVFHASTPLTSDNKIVLIMGSSVGTSVFCTLIPKAFSLLKSKIRQNLHCIHHAPEKFIPNLQETYSKLGVSHQISNFFPDIQAKMHQANLIIARAGASTIAEIAVTNKPAILIPSPNVSENHQEHNAKQMSRIYYTESEITAEKMARSIEKTLTLDTKTHTSIQVKNIWDFIKY